jgi:hypothetical protein
MERVRNMIDAYWFGAWEHDGLVYAGSGNEPGWRDGEMRRIAHPAMISMCSWGYHAADSWLHALQYARGPIACRVRIEVVDRGADGKLVGSRKLLVAHCDTSRELRLFAADCAERGLIHERTVGREPDPRSWRAVEATRQYAEGKINKKALMVNAKAAYDAAAMAAYDAAAKATFDAYYAATYAAEAAYTSAYNAYDAAAYAASDALAYSSYDSAAYAAELDWQSERLDWWMEQAFARKGDGANA